MNCRIVYRPDGTVTVIHPAPKSRKPKETEKAFLERVFDKAIIGTALEGLPYEDIDPKTLPDRKDRDKWRGKKGKGIKIDKTIVTIAEKRQAIEDNLDAEIKKPDFDTRKVLKMQRQLQTGNYA